MNKYNKGDKFEIEIGKTFDDGNGKTLYLIKGFNSLVFDEHGLNKIKRTSEAKPTYKVGDEVLADGGLTKFVVTHIGNDVSGIDIDGRVYSYFPDEICGVTGKRFDWWFEDTSC